MEWLMLVAVLVALTAGAVAAPPSPEPIIPGGNSGIDPGNGDEGSGESTVPSLPVEWQAMSCELDLAGVGFGGVKGACEPRRHHHHHHRHHHHHQESRRTRCCPVLASWLYAAQADALMHGLASSSASPVSSVEMPVPPDDSAACAAGIQQGLAARGIDLPPVNSSCDMSLCYCGIRLRQVASLSCPVSYFHRNRTALLPSQAPFLPSLQANCSDSSYNGCTSCLSALDNSVEWIQQKTLGRRAAAAAATTDCRLMGLMWLLSHNTTRFIPTVSAVLRAVLYSADPAAAPQCSPDEAKLPLADDTLASSTTRSSMQIHWLLLLVVLAASSFLNA